ncbi:MAG TPA: hypothetical protein VN375_07335 [Vicinamibacteria bacterium]|jgi:hypothetical protein|nr:hypothetical protein [Vicinamibacteria bacterium]
MRKGTRLGLAGATAAVKPAAQGIYGSYLPWHRDSWDRPPAPVYLPPASLPGGGRYPTAPPLWVRRDVRPGLGGMRNDVRTLVPVILADLAARPGVCGSHRGDRQPRAQAA